MQTHTPAIAWTWGPSARWASAFPSRSAPARQARQAGGVPACDGSFGLIAMELDAAVCHKLPVLVVISLDGGWTAGSQARKALPRPTAPYARRWRRRSVAAAMMSTAGRRISRAFVRRSDVVGEGVRRRRRVRPVLITARRGSCSLPQYHLIVVWASSGLLSPRPLGGPATDGRPPRPPQAGGDHPLPGQAPAAPLA